MLVAAIAQSASRRSTRRTPPPNRHGRCAVTPSSPRAREFRIGRCPRAPGISVSLSCLHAFVAHHAAPIVNPGAVWRKPTTFGTCCVDPPDSARPWVRPTLIDAAPLLICAASDASPPIAKAADGLPRNTQAFEAAERAPIVKLLSTRFGGNAAQGQPACGRGRDEHDRETVSISISLSPNDAVLRNDAVSRSHRAHHQCQVIQYKASHGLMTRSAQRLVVVKS